MSCVEEKLKPVGLMNGTHTLLEEIKLLKEMQDHSGVFISQCYFWHSDFGRVETLLENDDSCPFFRGYEDY